MVSSGCCGSRTQPDVTTASATAHAPHALSCPMFVIGAGSLSEWIERLALEGAEIAAAAWNDAAAGEAALVGLALAALVGVADDIDDRARAEEPMCLEHGLAGVAVGGERARKLGV